MHDQQVGRRRDLDDRSKIAQRIVQRLAREMRRDRMRARRGDQQRIAVGRGARHHVRTYHAAGAGTVVDDHLLPEYRTELLRQRARKQVRAATRRERRDNPDRFRRIRLCKRGRLHARRDASGHKHCDNSCAVHQRLLALDSTWLVHAPQQGSALTVGPHPLLAALFAAFLVPAPVGDILRIGDRIALQHFRGETGRQRFCRAG